MKSKLFIFLLLSLAVTAFGQMKSDDDRAMNRPFEPFHIVANIYYVGASDITSYLITTPKGHILIDAGYEETVPQIKANVEKLGFKLSDVKILLLNHAHYDHCGGMAELKRLTGARLLVSPKDASLLADGGKTDFHFGEKMPFEAVKADGILKNGELVKLGGTTLKTHFTPGHTKGATSWTTSFTEKGRKYSVLFMSSMTMLDYKLTNNATYPEIADDFRRTYATFASLKPDIFLVSHGQFFDLEEKAAQLKTGANPNPFIDPKGYRELVEAMTKKYKDRLASEKAGEKKQ